MWQTDTLQKMTHSTHALSFVLQINISRLRTSNYSTTTWIYNVHIIFWDEKWETVFDSDVNKESTFFLFLIVVYLCPLALGFSSWFCTYTTWFWQKWNVQAITNIFTAHIEYLFLSGHGKNWVEMQLHAMDLVCIPGDWSIFQRLYTDMLTEIKSDVPSLPPPWLAAHFPTL